MSHLQHLGYLHDLACRMRAMRAAEKNEAYEARLRGRRSVGFGRDPSLGERVDRMKAAEARDGRDAFLAGRQLIEFGQELDVEERTRRMQQQEARDRRDSFLAGRQLLEFGGDTATLPIVEVVSNAFVDPQSRAAWVQEGMYSARTARNGATIDAARAAQSPRSLTAFDAGVALQNGVVKTRGAVPPAWKKLSAADRHGRKAGWYVAFGLDGAAPDVKTAVVQGMAQNPALLAGAAAAVQCLANGLTADVAAGAGQSLSDFIPVTGQVALVAVPTVLGAGLLSLFGVKGWWLLLSLPAGLAVGAVSALTLIGIRARLGNVAAAAYLNTNFPLANGASWAAPGSNAPMATASPGVNVPSASAAA